MAKIPNTVEKNFYNPYSFVPLTRNIVVLEDDEINNLELIQDVPFEDSLSGKIEIDFLSKTRFCVLGADEHNTNVDGKYYVPGSSIKGMLRSVFEMLTCSNIKKQIENNRYSMRDLTSGSRYELKEGGQESGFIVMINEEYYIQPCTSDKIKYSEIEGNGIKEGKDVRDKYSKIPSRFKKVGDQDYMYFFTGKMQNKEHEYLFSIPNSFDNLIPIEEDVWNDFIFIHEKENENKSWQFWKSELVNYSNEKEVKKEGIVPCFFRTYEDEEGIWVKDFGLAYLYRQPYEKTIHDFLPKDYTSAEKENKIDITQSVFGFVNENADGREMSLKGRVFVGNSMLDSKYRPGAPQTFILDSPKPTFYPFYLKQGKGKDKKKTYFDDTEISGYKRYLLHNKELSGNARKSKTTSTFYPMPAETSFKTVVYFHNLQEYELGALLSAITFCNNTDKCYHSLGYAKPFGYGKLKVERCRVIFDDDTQGNVEELCQTFESLIKDCVGAKDVKTEYQANVDRLIALASGSYPTKMQGIRYPTSSMEKDNYGKSLKLPNEFVAIKNNNYNIDDFSPEK